jgi:hypothetical protein
MTDGDHPYGDPPPHGSIGEEAAKLAEAVQDWLGGRTGRAPRDVWATVTAESEEFHSPECRICPLCRAMRFFTSMNPQVFEHLTDAAASFSAALRVMAEDGERPGSTSAPADAGSEPSGGRPAPDSDGEA